ncbi:MAG: hypothetical protein LBV58_00960 [Acholeplasmatales bacterium]|jgi:predicted RNA-binding Zn-ribbon protein involved in translation (DUF1610 family)|nr:hypothetical protein [Acholeplasmatales bacterium]
MSEDIYNAASKGTNIEKCASCGSNLSFDPERQCLYCEACGSTVQIDFKKTDEQSFDDLFKIKNDWSNETLVFQCQNCGGKQVLSKKEVSKNCIFCGTPNVVQTEEISGYKPNAVVPFKISKEKAGSLAVKWGGSRFFAPSRFKKSLSNTDELNGVFSPAFTFDSNTFSTYYGTLGKYYYVTKVVNGKSVQERKIRYFKISGSYSKFFDDVLIQASVSLKANVIDKIQPFNTNAASVFKQDYLFGFASTQYDKDGKSCWKDAQDKMEKDIRSSILKRYDYDVISSFTCNVMHSNVTFKYLLLPLWIGHFIYKEKIFNFFLNGENGKITGKTPVSFWKVLSVVLGIAAVAATVIILVLNR